MEYFVGALITMMAYILTSKMFRKELIESEAKDNQVRLKYSQSHVYEMMRPYLDFVSPVSEDKKTQTNSYLKNSYMKIMVVKDKAYWIKDNRFMVANIIDGEIDKSNSEEVDTMNMDKVELDEMLFIVEKLREGEDDSRGSGQ